MGSGVVGIVLAGGAGTRFGGPKALARAEDGTPWLARAHDALRRGGCGAVVVVLGAGADEAMPLVPDGAIAVVAADAAEGLAETLRAGLAAARERDPAAVVIVPVDTPDLPGSAVARVIAAGDPHPRSALVRAVYAGRPGHPVLVGADHLEALAGTLAGDVGAGPYLRAHRAVAIECGDLWHGRDVDTHDVDTHDRDARPADARATDTRATDTRATGTRR